MAATDLEESELSAAARKYLEKLSAEERARLLDSESIDLKGFGTEVKLRGKGIVSDNLMLLLLAGGMVGFGVWHHITNSELLTKVLEATAENTYVLSLSPQDREKLNIIMPDSLRRKMRAPREQP